MVGKPRVKTENKSKPFTSFMFYIPKRVSVCGDLKFEKIWNNLITSKKGNDKIDMSAFLWKNIKHDLGENDFEDLINGYEYKRRVKEEHDLIWNLILDKLTEKGESFPSFQEYLRFIIEREQEKREIKKVKINDKSE